MGTRKNRLREAVLTSTTIYVLSRIMKNIYRFLSENLQFLVMKVSIYLNRRVFVMTQLIMDCCVRQYFLQYPLILLAC